MDIFKLKKPSFDELDKARIIKQYIENPTLYTEILHKVSDEHYYYWDTVKHLNPPANLTSIEFWYMIKIVRNISAKNTIITSEHGKQFSWVNPEFTNEYLHNIDKKLGGEIFLHYQHIITQYGKQRLLTKSIIEEAIASSQLEGAAITTPMAKKLLLENRQPKDKSEVMIVNNYKTMQAITDTYKNQKLSVDMLFELHRLITKDTLEPDKQGRYRLDSDGITINDQTNYIYHIPPKEVFLREEMTKLILYANDEGDKEFTHPVIKAIFLHFWIGYLHPFYDGNGRLARTLFYWYLLRKGYWAIQYLPISLVIKNAPDKYGMSYVYSEQDDFDLTYFYEFHIKKIIEALINFENYIRKKTTENSDIQNKLQKKYQFNDRQYELLRYLIVKGNDAYITPSSFVELNKISRETANKDLKTLEDFNLIEKKRAGRNMRYYATSRLQQEAT